MFEIRDLNELLLCFISKEVIIMNVYKHILNKITVKVKIYSINIPDLKRLTFLKCNFSSSCEHS